MSPKAKFIIILLAPFAMVLAALWVAAVWNALWWLARHSQAIGTDMWIKSMLALVSAGGFAIMAYFFVKVLRNPPRKKRRQKCYTHRD